MATIDANRLVPAADGTPLATDVYLPDRLPAAAVLTRTPYGRSALLRHGLGWARRGFAYVAQDVRGRYGSAGVWTPYQGERADGASLARWVRAQPWCAGKVVVAGASYGAFTAWATAVTVPELVQAVISEVPAAGLGTANVDPCGVLRLAEYAAWWTEHADGRTSRTGLAGQMRRGAPDLLRHLPVAELGPRLWARVPHWWSAAAAALSGAPAPAHSLTCAELAACPVPSLHVGGWYDLFLPQTLEQWAAAGRDHHPRPDRGLVIGPWAHELSTPGASSAGGREHGPQSRLPLGALQAQWVSQVLAGADATVTKVFLVGAGRWLPRWPPATRRQRWHATAEATLAPNPPATAARHQFRYDPLDPFPSLPVDQDRAALDSRTDAVVFRGPPLAAPVALAGTPVVRLHADSTAPCADWVVRLVQRGADGCALEVASAAVVARPDGQPLDVPLGPAALLLTAGSRLELQVTSSDFPRLARNLNTGQDRYRTTATRPATQTIHSGPIRGSYADLPVLEEQ